RRPVLLRCEAANRPLVARGAGRASRRAALVRRAADAGDQEPGGAQEPQAARRGMSYDLHVYACSDPAAALARLADEGELERNGESFAIRGKVWQAVFGPPDKVEPEDIPPGVSRELPGIAYLIEINIEGDAPDAAVSRAMR